jgi:hypothetical protein
LCAEGYSSPGAQLERRVVRCGMFSQSLSDVRRLAPRAIAAVPLRGYHPLLARPPTAKICSLAPCTPAVLLLPRRFKSPGKCTIQRDPVFQEVAFCRDQVAVDSLLIRERGEDVEVAAEPV